MSRSTRKLPISDYVADEIARGSTLDDAITKVAAQLGRSAYWVSLRCERKRLKSRSKV